MKTTSNFSIVLLFLAFLWETATADDTLSRYKRPLPPNVQIADTKPKLREFQDANPGALVGPENGGWFLKYPDSGKVVAASSDNLTIELDQRKKGTTKRLPMYSGNYKRMELICKS
ncbi:hypothetical protein TSTA_100390 [Talaromyces stipitatus ATCC 10500]|uniref:Uncharacterized protein n=1 Tax=Talaromyces stipitatus (strain ATCC 10500 / CBS 375.48 / QM 6759 / NRRL 1006) TaxID=441959 RepID=B8MLS7_TALSN|nr:uncharacterized protein TSTA_100390 [Talaromyces stipitatus ATCC 10500]EED13794.1 hypothetical protein TSTA_100390 [Talaromyces stipitatus ATCC 10500]